jgi:GTP-binding protein
MGTPPSWAGFFCLWTFFTGRELKVMIVDEAVITVEAGQGGNGCASFRREKYIPRGGPDGGNGGRGGDVFLEARLDTRTLVDFIYRPLFRAKHGTHGKGKNMHGRAADPVVIPVPVGTVVWSGDNELIADMRENGMRFLIAKGGRGGRGNMTFATATQKAPRLAENGEPGEVKVIRLELKLLADVGLLGFPNAGKSTLLSRVSQARPKIADYPFTTLEPHLGVVVLSDNRHFVMADVPGLIEGASEGRGLGIKFLRHLERTRLLLHLVDLSGIQNQAGLVQEIKTIDRELYKHSSQFKKIPQIIVLTKIDTVSNREKASAWAQKIEKKGNKVFMISAVSGEGLQNLLEECWKIVQTTLLVDEKTEDAEVRYEVKPRFKAWKELNGYHVSGREVEKWVTMTRFESRDSLERFQKILKRLGVTKELHRLGAKPGETIFLGDKELIFEPDHLERPSET